MTSSNPAGGAGAWTVAHADTGHALTAVSCASVSLCVAVDVDGRVVSSTTPRRGRRVDGRRHGEPRPDDRSVVRVGDAVHGRRRGRQRGVGDRPDRRHRRVDGHRRRAGEFSQRNLMSVGHAVRCCRFEWRCDLRHHPRGRSIRDLRPRVRRHLVPIGLAVRRGRNRGRGRDVRRADRRRIAVDGVVVDQANAIAVSCPTAGLCAAVDLAGNVAVSRTRPAARDVVDRERRASEHVGRTLVRVGRAVRGHRQRWRRCDVFGSGGRRRDVDAAAVDLSSLPGVSAWRRCAWRSMSPGGR